MKKKRKGEAKELKKEEKRKLINESEKTENSCGPFLILSLLSSPERRRIMKLNYDNWFISVISRIRSAFSNI
jgi:hypothetical protein